MKFLPVSMLLRTVIVDDESEAVNLMRTLLSRVEIEGSAIEVVGTASCAEEAFPLIGALKPDLLILDIKMRGESGMDLAKRVYQEDPRQNIIFVTAHMDFAFDAFDVEAVHYLLKPVSLGNLREALGRLITRVERFRQKADAEKSVEG